MNDKVYGRGKAVVTSQLSIEFADENFNSFLGENAVYKLGRSVHPDDMERLEDAMNTVRQGEDTVVALRLANCDGIYRWIIMSISNSDVKPNSKEKFFDIVIQDIFAYDDIIEDLQGSNERYKEYFSLIEQLMFSYDVNTDRLRIFMLGSHQQVNFYNGTFDNWKSEKLSDGYVDKQSINVFEHLCSDFKNGEANFEHELKMRVVEDSSRMKWCLIKGKTIEDIHNKKHVIATMSIVNAVGGRTGEASLFTDSKDVGTDLLNKRAITAYVQRMIESKNDSSVTIAIIDIDNFKIVNDQYGHMVGDIVIRDVAEVIKEAVEGRGIAGRIGGDEMFIVVENLNSMEDVRVVLRTIRNNIAWLYNNDDTKPNITCSIGSATYPRDAGNFDTLFNIADKMLYLAKEKGKNRYIIYRNDLHEDYINGVGSAAKTDSRLFYKYRKLSVANGIINAYCKYGASSFEESLKVIHEVFDIDSIFLYEKCGDSAWQRTVLFGGDIAEQKCEFIDSDNYMVSFTEEGVNIIDNINYFETKNKAAFKELSELGICQSVQFYVKEYDKAKRIVSFNRNKQVSKWADKEIMYLAIFGNIFGMGYTND